MGTPYKMKGSPMARNFGVGSPLHQDKSKKVITPAMEELMKRRAGLTTEEVEALKIAENRKNAKKKPTTYSYDGLDYTLAELKAIKAKKAKKAKKTGE